MAGHELAALGVDCPEPCTVSEPLQPDAFGVLSHQVSVFHRARPDHVRPFPTREPALSNDL
jgi:hypothetical protein